MASKADHYREFAQQCCLNAVMAAEDISRAIHWLEAAARWLAFARQEGVVLTAPTQQFRGSAVIQTGVGLPN